MLETKYYQKRIALSHNKNEPKKIFMSKGSLNSLNEPKTEPHTNLFSHTEIVEFAYSKFVSNNT